jgi:chemotaxis protein methyltransferase CheR
MTGNRAKKETGNEEIEARLFLEAIYLKYGYDFREYAPTHIQRRINHRLAISGCSTISEMTHRVLNDPSFFEEVLQDLSINVTHMFRDPPLYRALREEVVPRLSTYPFIKVWHAGCATGEEVYSFSILLQEEGLKDRTQTYATDFNAPILEQAMQGIYPMDRIRQYTANYQDAGGRNSFADYYTAMYDSVVMDTSLRKKVLFSLHNLVTDTVFGEMNIIFCRNVLIYFNRDLQDRVIKLFLDSLCPGGFLCLGSKESLAFSRYADRFTPVKEKDNIYRKSRCKVAIAQEGDPVPPSNGTGELINATVNG